ncbi:putative glutathione-S-transferase theta, GST [Pseudomassariella vexata]|uniref:Putative glutathione-S-transferase theta, GST n=1 Tax=Pseudomassariella vexata TaxID=1141098 RepID=A0A1Y2DHY5_9PEZI|nr:putative glutathione-S-transferase theta, GST [Pseudomassariella vexata]ORY58840.1 putative glutathione-S-transferase theta, GST [Pseudomassariella vexata]
MPLPDADLHPVATGLAKETVDRHSSPQPLKLYAGWFCPFVQRVWLALEERGIPYQYVEVNPYHKGADLISANPRGLVPTLVVAPKKALYESTVLLEYLEDKYPDHKPRLLPEDEFERARARIWTDFVTSRVMPAFYRFLQFQPGQFEDGEARLDNLRGEYRGKLLEYAKELDEEGPYFGGKEVGFVDLVLIPWVLRHWVFDRFKGGVGIPAPGQGGDDEKVWVRWRKWVEALEGRESIKNTTSEEQYYVPIYKTYADDVAQSELAKATREGRGVP